jgi:hypothetical protein
MLSARTLNRTSDQFRRGYHDGYEGRDRALPVADGAPGLFANFDYSGGYESGANDRRWDDYYARGGW